MAWAYRPGPLKGTKAMAKEKLNFSGLDTEAYIGPVKSAWDAYVKARKPITDEVKKLYDKLAPQQSALEEAVTAQLIRDGHLAQGQEAKFAYRFGGMAFAAVDAKASGKSKIVLGSSPGKKR
jgi:hypothetical protein